MPTAEQLQEWHKTFSRIERVDDYQKLKKHFESVCKQIEGLTESVANVKPPRNPREDAIQCHEKVSHRMLLRQKTRMEKQLQELATAIQTDLEASKTENL